MATNNPNKYVNSDLNVRLAQVNNNDVTVIVDKQAILQSIYRLFKTEEGEIPNFRTYGLNLKQYLQKPLSKFLAQDMANHVTSKINTFVPRVDVYRVNAIANFENSNIILQYYVKIKSTGEIVGLEPLIIPIG